MTVTTRSTEELVFFEVQAIDGTGWYACGQTAQPLRIDPGTTLQVNAGLDNWLVTTHCPAHRVKTVGQIRVTLSKRP